MSAEPTLAEQLRAEATRCDADTVEVDTDLVRAAADRLEALEEVARLAHRWNHAINMKNKSRKRLAAWKEGDGRALWFVRLYLSNADNLRESEAETDFWQAFAALNPEVSS